jgi:rubrerythrin
VVLVALDVFQDLFSKEEITSEKILHDLLDSTKGLNMKTDIMLPVEMSAWDTYANILDYYKMKKSAKVMRDFSKLFKEHMVSYKRKSRGEITNTIAGLLQQKNNRGLLDKLTGMNKER